MEHKVNWFSTVINKNQLILGRTPRDDAKLFAAGAGAKGAPR
jgi:hypothetical protein